ncbi:hypothetical protein CgunFtcFv8_027837 [Champsocephalus gunnari]|uniref:Uncharacterized protein n=1 Tax=Champsocephalus gunnari TaxID=52237 RepID=A0AAN8E702_CHAGU|nr:hypothetical protein CgunFtcFv8_027837 [Champsocephalus gunnari]
MAEDVARHSPIVSALEDSKTSDYKETMHDLLGTEDPDFYFMELFLRDMRLRVQAALANTARVEPCALAEEADRFFLAARQFTPEVLATARSDTFPGGGTPPSRGSGADDID